MSASEAPSVYDQASALVVVDMQNDFAHRDGSLYVDGGEEIIPVINEQVHAANSADALVVYTQDWHPESTPHFAKDGGTWPTHCVQGSWGATFHADLDVGGPVVRKGSGGEDGYSGFTVRDPDAGTEAPTVLDDLLAERGIRRLVVVGLAQDVCVKGHRPRRLPPRLPGDGPDDRDPTGQPGAGRRRRRPERDDRRRRAPPPLSVLELYRRARGSRGWPAEPPNGPCRPGSAAMMLALGLLAPAITRARARRTVVPAARMICGARVCPWTMSGTAYVGPTSLVGGAGSRDPAFTATDRAPTAWA